MSYSKLCLEDLSNELFMEIFDYLYGQEIFFIFFNLNHRFNSLCNHYPKYCIDTTDSFLNRRTYRYLRDSLPSKYIYSLKFSAEKWIASIPNTYFTSLHSLTFINMHYPMKIKEFLQKLPSPEQLYYLKIESYQYECDLEDLGPIIFNLPNLIHLELNVARIKLNLTTITQPLLSLQYFLFNCYKFEHMLQIFSFMSNLISLSLPSGFYGYTSDFIIQPNTLSKLKILRMKNIKTYHEIHDIFQLCPQIELFQVQCDTKSLYSPMIRAKDWEKILLPMKYLKKIEINIYGFSDRDGLNLSEYNREFWKEKHLKSIAYFDEGLDRWILSIKQSKYSSD